MDLLRAAVALMVLLACCSSQKHLSIQEIRGDPQKQYFRYVEECSTLVDSIETALSYNHLRKAHRLLRAAEGEGRYSSELFALRGDLFYRQNQLDSAQACFENALQLSDSSVDSETVRDIRTLLGMVHYQLKEYSTAATYFTEDGAHRSTRAFGRFLQRFHGRTPYRLRTTGNMTRIRIVDVDPFPKTEVTVNGRGSDDFILDTGCNFVTLSSGFADKCGIDVLETFESASEGESKDLERMRVDLAIIDSLQLGDFVFYNVPATIIDSKRMSFRFLGITLYKLEGALGLPILKELKTTVDYNKGEAILELPEPERNPDSTPNLAIVDNVLYTHAQFNEQSGFNAFVDSGTKYSAITQAALTLLDSTEVRFEKRRRSDREHSARRVNVIHDCVPNAFVIDDYSVDGLKFEVIGGWHTRGRSNLTVQAIIAKDLLRHFVTTYDFVNMRIDLIPVHSD
jgi:tetratricopeptide (TPR) repeat protein